MELKFEKKSSRNHFEISKLMQSCNYLLFIKTRNNARAIRLFQTIDFSQI